MDHSQIARLIETSRDQLGEEAAALMLASPFLSKRFPNVKRKRILLDMDANISALIKAVRYRSPMLLEDHVIWRRKVQIERNFSTGMLRQEFAQLWTAITNTIPVEAQSTIHDYVMAAMQALVYRNPQVLTLMSTHEQLVEDLVASSYDTNWDWQAAYRPAGREAMLYDAWWCIDYLIDSLGINNPAVLGAHLCWMRDHLIAHGLGTVHIQQLLWQLLEAAEQRLTPEVAGMLRRTLDAAGSYLTYEQEACNALLAAQEDIVSDAARLLVEHGLASQPEYAAFEMSWYVAYLYDCLARADAGSLHIYRDWMRQGLDMLGQPDSTLVQIMTALEQAVKQHLPPEAAEEVIAMLLASHEGDARPHALYVARS